MRRTVPARIRVMDCEGAKGRSAPQGNGETSSRKGMRIATVRNAARQWQGSAGRLAVQTCRNRPGQVSKAGLLFNSKKAAGPGVSTARDSYRPRVVIIAGLA